MPPSSDQPSSAQQPPIDISLFYKEEAPRRSPGRKAQGKNKKRNDSGGENVEKEKLSGGLPREITSTPSILSQLQAPPFQPPAPSNGISTTLLNPTLPTHQPDFSTQSTTEWSRNIPFGPIPPEGHSNSNGASIAGSPQPAITEFRGGFAHISPPTSPRATYRQPIHRNTEYQSFGDYLASSHGSKRPASMQSQNSQHPPPPHHPQPHYYGAPEIDFGSLRPNIRDVTPGEGYCCTFDSLPFTSQGGSKNTENILLVGFEGGLNIYHVDEKRLNRIGRLQGLRGSVIGAKILLSSPFIDQRAIRPLVAVIIHGPITPPDNAFKAGPSQGGDNEFDASDSTIHTLHSADEPVANVPQYQTTVEVYSLRKGIHVATLFSSPMVDANVERYNAHPSQPPAVGDLAIQANGRFIVVSSGTSGEVFAFESILSGSSEMVPIFKCIGKFWTRTWSRRARSMSASSNDSGSGRMHDASTPGTSPKIAILSLSRRWLAVVPPPSSSQTTLHGQVEMEHSTHQIPGLASHTSPTEPQITCGLDMPEKGSLFNRVARDVAQGALKGAQWVAAEGMRAWTNYWSRPSEQHRQAIATSPPNYGMMGPVPAQQEFPPTHAQDNHVDRAKNQPTIVSVLDLEQLSQSQHLKPTIALQPLATFSLPAGCSLVSFSSDGLHLLTASAKGDDHHVWDLMRMVHGETERVGDPDACPKGPTVRQVAHFSRMTEARIIDVVWTEPRGERLAIITEKGTVHIYDIPSPAFLWPPFRRIQRKAARPNSLSTNDSNSDEALRPKSTDSTFSSALGVFTDKTQPLLAAVRGRSPSGGGRFPGFPSLAMTAGAGAKSGKAVAAGINRSVSAAATGTVHTLRHLGENRISLPTSTSTVAPGCVRWLSGKSRDRIAVTGGGIIRIYSLHQSSNSKAGQGRPSIIGRTPTEFSLPTEPVPVQRAPDKQRTGAPIPAEASMPPRSFWLLHSSNHPLEKTGLNAHPLSYAEIDTSAPYRPFYTDRRVNLRVYDEDVEWNDLHHLQDTRPWAFGEPITTKKLTFSSLANDREESGDDQAVPGQMENVVNIEGNLEDGQQVVVTTRRKRNKKGEEAVVEDKDEIFDDFAYVDLTKERV